MAALDILTSQVITYGGTVKSNSIRDLDCISKHIVRRQQGTSGHDL